MSPVQFWWCEDWILLMKTKIWSLHCQTCTGVIDMGINRILSSMLRCKDYFGSHPLSVSTHRVNPYFRIVVHMTQSQSLHLRIDDRVWLIPISMKPVQFWRCEDWIFVDENKIPVTAPPDLHRHHLYGYHINSIINMEVQGPFWKSPAPSINT